MELADISPFLHELVDSWYASLGSPADTQQKTLETLLRGYAKTDYGKKFGAAQVRSIPEFQTSFPVIDYAKLAPYLEDVKQGRYGSLLSEPVQQWVMTRGSTGKSKVIPTTETHLSQILAVGARAIVNFALSNRDVSVLEKGVLNLNFPSQVGVMPSSSGDKPFGYSSGTYARLNPSLGAAALVPPQEEIDVLGGGVTPKDWESRFELVYQRARKADVGCLMGVTSVMVAFASYLRKRHDVLPRELWKLQAIFCTSVAKIHTKYEPVLKHSYGQVPIVEMYTATEGVFAQQLDANPYVSPNYDIYLFEVNTRSGIKLLHELRPREWGSIVVSSTLFPRYEMGDYIESMGRGYYRVFGRMKSTVVLEHMLFNILTARVGPKE